MNILAVLGLKKSGFKQGLDEAKNDVARFKKDASGGGFGKSIADSIGSIISLGAIKSVVDYGDRLDDLSQRFGVAQSTLEKWGHAADQNGSSMEGLALGFNKLIINQSKAIAGDLELESAFERLGVSADDLKALAPEQLMQKLAQSSLNTADVVAVLGKNALELVPMLEAVADGSAELAATMSDETAHAMGTVSDAFKDLKKQGMDYGAWVLSKGIEIAKATAAIFSALKNDNTAPNGQLGILDRIKAKWDDVKEAASDALAEQIAGEPSATPKPRDRPDGETAARVAKDEEAAAKRKMQLAIETGKIVEENAETAKKAQAAGQSADQQIQAALSEIQKNEAGMKTATENGVALLEKKNLALREQVAALVQVKIAQGAANRAAAIAAVLETPADRHAKLLKKHRDERAARVVDARAALKELNEKKNARQLPDRHGLPVAPKLIPLETKNLEAIMNANKAVLDMISNTLGSW